MDCRKLKVHNSRRLLLLMFYSTTYALTSKRELYSVKHNHFIIS